jgi:hypothetical protein
MTLRDRFYFWRIKPRNQQRLQIWAFWLLIFGITAAIFAGCWAISDAASGCPAGMHQDVAGVELGGEYYGCVEDR